MNLCAKYWPRMTVAMVAFLACGSMTGPANAEPIRFSVTGTAISDGHGYENGKSYAFDWILNSGFTENIYCGFEASENYWSDEITSHSPIFTDVSVDGLTGTWQRPSFDLGDPYSFVRVFLLDNTHRLTLYAEMTAITPLAFRRAARMSLPSAPNL